MKKDLRYQSVKAWPIYERENGGAIMYYMIHATDHPEAPKFMSRAYRRVVYFCRAGGMDVGVRRDLRLREWDRVALTARAGHELGQLVGIGGLVHLDLYGLAVPIGAHAPNVRVLA